MRKYWTGSTLDKLAEDEIFVFGSNPEGRHGLGAAKAALKFGAVYRQGRGLHGQTYALITKNLTPGFVEEATGIVYERAGLRSVDPEQIKDNIRELYRVAEANPGLKFLITYQNLGKNLNGFDSSELAELFHAAGTIPQNIVFHDSFRKLIEGTPQFSRFTFFFRSTSPFSQWHPSAFRYREYDFISCEQFMMFSKAKLFDDDKIAERIMHFSSAGIGAELLAGTMARSEIIQDAATLKRWDDGQRAIKALGRDVRNFNEEVWVSKRTPIITVANREKFSQDPELQEILLATSGTCLVEASKFDRIYGIGMEATDPDASDPSKWRGLNLLGKVLDAVRDTGFAPAPPTVR